MNEPKHITPKSVLIWLQITCGLSEEKAVSVISSALQAKRQNKPSRYGSAMDHEVMNRINQGEK